VWKERKDLEKYEGGETFTGPRFKRNILEIK
jgi:hypothetical protein